MKRTILAASILAFSLALSAHAQTESILFAFPGTLGPTGAFYPNGGLLMDASGNIYGTTIDGGTPPTGIVFKLTPSGSITVLHSFSNNNVDGYLPNGGLVMDSQGNLYGTTIAGGTNNAGTVFKIAPDGTETILHNFKYSATDGFGPQEGLAIDSQGNLYGTTARGGVFVGQSIADCPGNNGCGTVFEVTPTGVEIVLHNFIGPDGALPGTASTYGASGLTLDAAGNLYGATAAGGAYNYGTVYKLNPSTRAEIVLHSFNSNGADGTQPLGGLAIDSTGNIYGTTKYGGPANTGLVFQIAPNGVETIIYNIQNFGGGGVWSGTPGLLIDKNDNLYGAAQSTGTQYSGYLFELSPPFLPYQTRPLHAFPPTLPFTPGDGAQPQGGLAIDSNGDIYGATMQGGTVNNGGGTIYKLTPPPVLSLLTNSVAFSSQATGTTSASQVVQVSNIGVEPIALSARLTGPNASEFTESDDCQSVPWSGFCGLFFTFTPTSIGPATATLVLTDTAGDSLPTVTLSGTGTTPIPPPVFSPVPGNYAVNQQVTLTDPLAGTVIYYTVNGGAPVKYTGPITLTSTETIQAYGVIVSKTGYTVGSPSTALYTIVLPPTTPILSLPAGTYTNFQQLTIQDATVITGIMTGSTTPAGIYFTVDGSAPIPYTGPIPIQSTETIKAVAYELLTNGVYLLSTPITAKYTLPPQLCCVP